MGSILKGKREGGPIVSDEKRALKVRLWLPQGDLWQHPGESDRSVRAADGAPAGSAFVQRHDLGTKAPSTQPE